MWADVNSHQSHWLGWSAHDLQGDSSSAMLTANYSDIEWDYSDITVRFKENICNPCTASLYLCRSKWNTTDVPLKQFCSQLGCCILCNKNNIACRLHQLNVLYLVYNEGKKYLFEINRGDMASLSLKCQVPQQIQLQVYLHLFTFHRSGMREGYNRLSWGNHVWENRKRLSM